MPELAAGVLPRGEAKNKVAKKQAIADRALADLQIWLHGQTSQRLPAVHPA
jgi:hypothetical protein